MSLDDVNFRRRVDAALEKVRQILHNTRSPVYAADAEHSYADKFALCNLLVRLAVGCTVQGMTSLGIADKDFQTLLEWAKDKTVSLRFQAEEKCTFVKDIVREVHSSRLETTGHVGSMSFGSSSKTVTKITEYVWKFEGKYKLLAFRGVGSQAADQIAIRGREYTREMITAAKSNPRHEHLIFPDIDVDISWLLRHVKAGDSSVVFEINRAVDSCKTPRRNNDVETAISQLETLSAWCGKVRCFFSNELFRAAEIGLTDRDTRLDMNAINAEGVFVPVIPVFVEESGTEDGGQLTFKPTDVSSFLQEQQRTLTEKIGRVAATLPSTPGALVTDAEAHVCICVEHMTMVVTQLQGGLSYVEQLLYTQLYAAVGKHITVDDFAAFKRFHNRKLFRDDMQPLPFSFSVRRSPIHSPEGLITIEETAGGVDGSVSTPVYTHVRAGQAVHPMRFSISAATSVQFRGERFLHAWLMHRFSGQRDAGAQLTAQARQLSSFIVLIGKIASADTFEPKYGMIVQNKDDFRVPLKLDTIPTPKEFKDAIESLSPEQQEFCKAWRAMQLESTLFAVCVVQIKPLLERVLNLPPESLSKEIKLTQDLTELFIKYQIPADLLSAARTEARPSMDGAQVVAPNPADQVAEVKANVEAMSSLIAGEEQKQLHDAAQTAVFEGLHTDGSSDANSSSDEEDECVPNSARSIGTDEVLSAQKFQSRSALRSMAAPLMRMAAPAMAKRSAAPAPHAIEMEVAKSTPVTARTSVKDSAPPLPKSLKSQPTPTPAQEKTQIASGNPPPLSTLPDSMEDTDVTKLPAQLDAKLGALDAANAVRPTIISPKDEWRRKRMASLLSKEPETTTLGTEELRGEKQRAFELLDALTRSGALLVEEAALHVVIGATHTFDKGLVDTVVMDNVNPIIQVERSSLIMSSTVMGVSPARLVKTEHLPRLQAGTPALFVGDAADEARALSGLQE